MTAAADALGVARLGLAAVFPAALIGAVAEPGGSWTPLILFAAAAASDFVDGRLARRAAIPSRHGAVLDVAADVTFVLAAGGSAAALGLVPWAAPAAIALAAGAYAFAALGRGGLAPARSGIGHAAGVLNYALVGLVAGAAALPGPLWPPLLYAASLVVIAVNLTAVLQRL